MHTSNEQQTHQNIYKGGNQQTFFDQPLSSNYRSVWRVQSILALMVIVSRGQTTDKQQQTIERQDKRTAKTVNKEMINDFDLSSNGHFRPLHPRATLNSSGIYGSRVLIIFLCPQPILSLCLRANDSPRLKIETIILQISNQTKIPFKNFNSSLPHASNSWAGPHLR